ncbi:transmembrane protein 180 isoform X4 [Sus scrofa]|uniref:transmembrane protein 180 isoform X4 n=1 Tax=Sus scrofa TaxID=9823 RepID=UPI0003AE8A64|nr:transmembrane protein 180 isoform X4 [Sus scrofa]
MELGGPWAWLLGLPTAVVYGSLALFVSVLHNVFLLYYVDTFVSVYKINKAAFWVGEVRCWALLEGCGAGAGAGAGLAWAAAGTVVPGVLGALGPGWPAVPAVPVPVRWLPDARGPAPSRLAGRPGPLRPRPHPPQLLLLPLQCGWLPVCLCLLRLLEQGGLLFLPRLLCGTGRLLWAGLCRSHAAAEAAGRGGRQGAGVPIPGCGRLGEEELLVGGKEAGSITLSQYLRQLARHRNFLWFVGMDLVQVFHCHFNSNFFPLFLEHLLSDHISLSTGSFLLGISYVAPHLNNLYFLPLCRRWGVYAVVRGLFLLKLGLSLLMLLAGPDHPGLLCLFIASNRVFTEGTCKLLTLVVTDLVDEDLVLNHRKQAASALLFGMVALVTKPGQTFAPLLGTWLLCFYTGHDLFQQPPLTPVGSAQPWPEPPAPPPAQAPALRQGCFYLLVLVPITCALLQLFTWSQFTLHGRRLHMVKAQRQNLARAQTLDVKTV